ncbi:hypothetical protein JCM11251_004240 [Rhodosporidiobolus azoricus]
MALLDSGQAGLLPGAPSHPVHLLQQLSTLVSVSSVAKTTRVAMHSIINQIRPFLASPTVPSIVFSAAKNPVNQPTARQNASVTSANTIRDLPPTYKLRPPSLSGTSELAQQNLRSPPPSHGLEASSLSSGLPEDGWQLVERKLTPFLAPLMTQTLELENKYAALAGKATEGPPPPSPAGQSTSYASRLAAPAPPPRPAPPPAAAALPARPIREDAHQVLICPPFVRHIHNLP